MVAGGTPISRSRVMPPARPTTTASTTTPKRSSRARTPAMPPLSPNANVPARLRASSSMGSTPGSTAASGARGKPDGRQHDRAGACLEYRAVCAAAEHPGLEAVGGGGNTDPGLPGNRQRVHVGAQHHCRPLAVALLLHRELGMVAGIVVQPLQIARVRVHRSSAASISLISRYGVTAMAAPSPPIFRIIVDRVSTLPLRSRRDCRVLSFVAGEPSILVWKFRQRPLASRLGRDQRVLGCRVDGS